MKLSNTERKLKTENEKLLHLSYCCFPIQFLIQIAQERLQCHYEKRNYILNVKYLNEMLLFFLH